MTTDEAVAVRLVGEALREHGAAFDRLALEDGPRPHSCPNCECPRLCGLCKGMGFIMTADGRPESYPGANDGWGSIGSRSCPNGCPSVTLVL